ncbi:hypothetical protein F4679DRAFT_412091 [Xylaria curta]|nr:hypothetical protein F4679DRAFT_412091 [Xylaria curta]
MYTSNFRHYAVQLPGATYFFIPYPLKADRKADERRLAHHACQSPEYFHRTEMGTYGACLMIYSRYSARQLITNREFEYHHVPTCKWQVWSTRGTPSLLQFGYGVERQIGFHVLRTQRYKSCNCQ